MKKYLSNSIFLFFVCWIVSAVSFAQRIAGGGSHSLAICTDSTVWTWGASSIFVNFGQLGDNTTTGRVTPVQVHGPANSGVLSGIIALGSGEYSSNAVKKDGTVWSWGRNFNGQLGDNTTTGRLTPVQVLGPAGIGVLTGITALGVTADNHSIAVKNDGTAWAWGDNTYGQLGDNTTTGRLTPVQVRGLANVGVLTGIIAVGGDEYHSIALKNDGTVWAWGDNTYGQLGDNTTTARLTPVQVRGPANVGVLTGIIAVAAGQFQCIALKNDGTVWTWGRNNFGQLGDNTTIDRLTPVQVLGPGGVLFLTGITSIAGGDYHTIALKNDSTVWDWGRNTFGSLGDNTNTDRLTPVQVRGSGNVGVLSGIIAIAAGDLHSLAIKNDGTIWGWGDNGYGTLGDNTTTTPRNTPVQVQLFCLVQPTVLTATITAVNINCNGGFGSANVTAAGGTPNYRYAWSPSGGSTSAATGLIAGTYTVIVTDAAAQIVTKTITITEPTAITATTTAVNINCNGGTGSASIAVGGGTPGYTYNWSPSGGNNTIATGLSAGTYTILVTDTGGCTSKKTLTITQPVVLTATTTAVNINCNGGTGSASVAVGGGTPGYTYNWFPSGGNGSTATGLSAGTYTILVTDNGGCTYTKTLTITQPAVLTATITSVNINCNGGTGSASVAVGGGTPGYTYNWSPSGGNSSTVTGLGAGTHTILVTDANGCVSTTSVIITQPTAITGSITATQADCGSNIGTATVTVSGGTPGYTYVWLPSGGNSSAATGLGVGSYTCTITDANGCTKAAIAIITSSGAPFLTLSGQTNVLCNGQSTGSASVTASGGTPGYTYKWSAGGSTSATTGLIAGNYFVIVTDAIGCSNILPVTIIEPSVLTATTTAVNINCNGGTGSASILVGGGHRVIRITGHPREETVLPPQDWVRELILFRSRITEVALIQKYLPLRNR